MREASTDASQKENLKEVSTETYPIKESTLEIVTDLSEKDKEPSALEASSSTLELPSPLELKLSLLLLRLILMITKQLKGYQ